MLLKAYQGEIDALTRRSKTSETSFLNVYKLLSDAPDPYPLLDAAVDQTVKVAEARMLESELSRLREENADLKKQVAESSSLEDKRKKAEAKVDQIESKVWAAENQLTADGRSHPGTRHSKGERAQRRVRREDAQLRGTVSVTRVCANRSEKDLQRQVQTFKDQIRILHTSNESTQAKLMDASQRQGELC